MPIVILAFSSVKKNVSGPDVSTHGMTLKNFPLSIDPGNRADWGCKLWSVWRRSSFSSQVDQPDFSDKSEMEVFIESLHSLPSWFFQ